MYGTGTCTVFRIRIQWIQIKIRLVCPDPNFNKAQILDPDSMNPDPKHSYRYVSISVARHTDELSRYRYLYGFSWSWSEILVQLCTVPVLSREPQKKKTQTRTDCSAAPTHQALCLRLASMYKAESWQRAVFLDNSTPQCRISELRVWSYEPFIAFASSSSG